MEDWGHLEWIPPSKAPTTTPPTSAAILHRCQLPHRRRHPPGLPHRSAVVPISIAVRSMTTPRSTPSGTVKVQVGGKTATEKAADKTELFKNGSMTTMEQMPHTATNSDGGPTR